MYAFHILKNVVIEVVKTSSSLYPSITEEIALLRETIQERIREITKNDYLVNRARVSLMYGEELQQVKEEVGLFRVCNV